MSKNVVTLKSGSEQGRSQPRRSEGAPASGRWARGWVRTNVSPSGAGVRGSWPPYFFCIFLIQNPAFYAFLAPKMGTTGVFIKTPMHWGNEDCWKRLPNEARRGENLGRRRHGPCISWGRNSKPHQLWVWQWCKQDQILKTKTKITRPRPPEVNKRHLADLTFK